MNIVLEDATGQCYKESVELLIDPAHAGDNFIVVADLISANVTSAKLGETEAKRYEVEKVNGVKLAQTPLLTVWRRLWMELDQMAAPTATAADGFDPAKKGNASGQWNDTAPVVEPADFDVKFQPTKPDISILTSAMVAACIVVKEVSQGVTGTANADWIVGDSASTNPNKWDTTTPFVHNLSDFNDAAFKEVSKKSRDVNSFSPEFWNLHGTGAYEANAANDWDGAGEKPYFGGRTPNGSVNPAISMIFDETIRDFQNTATSNNGTKKVKRSTTEINQLATMHEVLHCFGLKDYTRPGDSNYNGYDVLVDGKIMNANDWLWDDTFDESVNLIVGQIKKIQSTAHPK